MIIFQRLASFLGPPQEVSSWAVEITDAVKERTELDVSLWQGLFGGPNGSLAWSTQVSSLTALEASMDALAADPDYVDLQTRGREWIQAPAEDHLLRMIHIAGGEYVRPAVGGYAEVTRAVPAEGQLAGATSWGVEIADMHANLTHAGVIFCQSSFGPFGQLGWLGLYDSAAAVDEAAEAIAKDEGYTAKLDQGGGLFQEGSAERTLARRIH